MSTRNNKSSSRKTRNIISGENEKDKKIVKIVEEMKKAGVKILRVTNKK